MKKLACRISTGFLGFKGKFMGSLHGRKTISKRIVPLLLGMVLVTGSNAQVPGFLSVTWRPNSEPNVAGYYIYYGPRSGAYTNRITVGRNANSARVEPLVPGGKYYLAMTAFNSEGTESAFSRELTNSLPTISAISDQSVDEDTVSGAISFTVSDAETVAGELRITARSSNPMLVPNEYVLHGGTGNQRSLMIVPQLEQAGQSEITVEVRDAQGATSVAKFSVSVEPANDDPVVFPIPNQIVREDAGAVTLPVYIFDAESDPDELWMIAVSANPSMIRDETIRIIGHGNTRTLSFVPVKDAYGPGVMQVYVLDPEGAFSMTEFTVDLQSVNDPPTISSVGSMVLNEDTPSPFVPVNVSDIDNAPADLVLSAFSSDPSLIGTEGIVFGGPPGKPSMVITPRPNQFGSCVVSLKVDDPAGGSSTNSFTVTVNGINDPPNIDAIPDFSIEEGSPPLTLPLSGINSGASNEIQSLDIAAVSSHPGIIPVPVVSYLSPNNFGSLLIAPLPDTNGTATITVFVTDGASDNGVTSRSFKVSVNTFNNPPVIHSLPNLAVLRLPNPLRIDFSVQDPDTTADRLTVSGYSSDLLLLPNSNLVFAGTGTQRSLTINPVLGRTGVATVTVVVSDGSAAVSTSFYVIVSVAGT